MSNRFVVAALALVLPAVAAASPSPQHWQKSFTVTGRPAVRVSTNDGSIHVRTGPAGKIDASVRYEEHHWGFTSPSREPEVDLHQDGDVVTVTAKEPSIFAMFGGISARLEIEVVVPADCDLDVRSGDGSITSEQPLTGKLSVHTGDGSIRVHGASGAVLLSTSDGRISADQLDGTVSARSGDGAVQLSGRFDRLEVHASDGRVDVEAVRGSKVVDDWRIESADGPVTVRIPRDLAAELEASTGDGRLQFDLPVTVSGPLNHHSIHGLLNGGGPLLRVRTQDGSLRLAVSD
jgi:hypothetical protein